MSVGYISILGTVATNFFEHFNDLKLKNSKLKSRISHRELQLSYRNHLHLTAYKKDTIFPRRQALVRD
jgi:hypothetical protein